MKSPVLRRVLFWSLVLVVISVLIWRRIPSESAAPEAGQRGPGGGGGGPMPVEAYLPVPERLADRFETAASLRASEQVDIRSQLSGRIAQLPLQEGQFVREGTVLLRIEDDELRAQVRRTEERLGLARAQSARQAQLFQAGAIAEESYEAKEAEVRVLEAELELLAAQIEKTEIRAPFSGVTGLRQVSIGAYVTPQTPITTLQVVNPLMLEFSVPERYAARIRPGQTVQFEVEGVTGQYPAVVYAADATIDPNTRTRTLRARVTNPGQLLPGAFARVMIALNEVSDALTVPTSSLVPVQGGAQVFVVRQGKATPQRVETGLRLADRVHVISGLTPQDTVLVSSLQRLRPGMPVLPVLN